MSSIESSIGHREEWATDGPNGRLKIVRFRPSGETDLGQSPLVIIPGWSNGQETMEPLAKRASMMGFEPITFSYERSTKPDSDPLTHKIHTAEAVAQSALHRFGGTSVQLKGFSEGGIVTTKYAMLEHQRQSGLIDKATLDAPAGISTDGLHDLLGGAAREVANNLKPRHLNHLGRKAIVAGFVSRYITENPGLSIREVWAINNTNTIDDIAELHDAGLPIGVTGLTRDGFFPADKLRRSVPQGVPFAEMDGTHVDYLVNPAVQDHVLRFHRNETEGRSAAAA